MVLKVEAYTALCSIFTFYFAGSPVLYTPTPRGECPNCCELREARDIQFQLYTKSNPITHQMLYVSDKNRLERSNLNKSDPVIVFLHGFSEKVPGGPGQSSQEVRDAFLQTGNYNVILVDWSPLTAIPWYINSVQNSPRVGRYVARFLRFLIHNGVPRKRIHLVGFSLGAEVAGFAGKTMKEWGITLDRITGLDPAFPFFYGGTESRLSATDAKFVDVIHTDGGVFGYPIPLGDADFFPNNGVQLQPGCGDRSLDDINSNWIYNGQRIPYNYYQNYGRPPTFYCSHQRAWQYFIESVRRPTAFMADRCVPNELSKDKCRDDVTPMMGMAADKRLRGKFFLTTNPNPPYGRNRR